MSLSTQSSLSTRHPEGATAAPFIDELLPRVIDFRRAMHSDPELSRAEERTSERIVTALREAGLEPHRLAGTGAFADVGSGPIALALRADIDALPVAEETGLPYASRNPGVAHACGHDIHTSVMLGVALALKRYDDAHGLGATVRFIFQPAEETTPGGALDVISQGLLEDVPRVLALHADPRVDVGQIGTRIGAITSASDTIRIQLSGRGGHTSRPHLTEDLVFALAQIAVNVPAVLSRRVDVRSGVSVVWGHMSAGSAPNAIPATGLLAGTMRCLDAGAWEGAGALLDEVVQEVAAPYGVVVELNHVRGVPPVVNQEAETTLLEAAARAELGPNAVVLTPQSMGGEDFAWMTQEIPGAMMRLGTRTPGGETFDLHRGDYAPDEGSVEVGMRVMSAAALAAIAQLRGS